MTVTRAKREGSEKVLMRFMRRKKPRNTCCPITLNKLGPSPPYYLLFESDLLYVFEAHALSLSCKTSGPYSPISRRKLLSVELRRLARCVGVNVEDLNKKDEEEEADSITSFLSEEVGSVIDSITLHLDSLEETESVLDRQHGHLCQCIVNLCQVSTASAREVLQTHIRRVQLMSMRAHWVSAQAASLLIDELRHLSQMTDSNDSDDSRSMHQTIRRALRVMHSETRRAQQIQVDRQLARYVDTGIPTSIRNPPQRIVFSNRNASASIAEVTPVNLVEMLQEYEQRQANMLNRTIFTNVLTDVPTFQITSLDLFRTSANEQTDENQSM